ncbi:MAG TPA: hypothetical protein VFK58_08730 [Sphingomicrobium sp.]|nr:hypothetical protein [Sphingomicrobium sp.]
MPADAMDPPPSRRALVPGLAAAAALVAAVIANIAFDLGWPGAIAAAVLVALFAWLMFRAGEQRARETGNFSPAMGRYNRRMMAASLLYIVGLFTAIYAHDTLGVDGVAAFGTALLPSAGVLWMVWAMARLIAEEEDEYQRHRHVRASLFGLGTLLTLATLWGFFEQFDLVPHVPTWAAVPVFALGLGVAHCTRWARL